MGILGRVFLASIRWLIKVSAKALTWAWKTPGAGLVVGVLLAPIAEFLASRNRRFVRAIGLMLRGVSYSLAVTAGVAAASTHIKEEVFTWFKEFLPDRETIEKTADWAWKQWKRIRRMP